MKVAVKWILIAGCVAGGTLHAVNCDNVKEQREKSSRWLVEGGLLINADRLATLQAHEHFELGLQAIEERNWRDAFKQFFIVSENFPESPYSHDAYYYTGVAYFFTQEYQLANNAFNQYLEKSYNPKFFEEAIEYKYCIADRFSRGSKKRPFASKQFPMWMPAYDLAQEIFDEVIAAMPSHAIAIKATYAKGWLHWKLREFPEAVEAFQALIQRFPKDELAPECFLNISRVYLDQCRREFQNPDLLAFSEINLRKFQEQFPREERIADAEHNLLQLKEVYAEGFYETGRFYERKECPGASVIYYENTLHRFPETDVARLCRKRLEVLGR